MSTLLTPILSHSSNGCQYVDHLPFGLKFGSRLKFNTLRIRETNGPLYCHNDGVHFLCICVDFSPDSYFGRLFEVW